MAFLYPSLVQAFTDPYIFSVVAAFFIGLIRLINYGTVRSKQKEFKTINSGSIYHSFALICVIAFIFSVLFSFFGAVPYSTMQNLFSLILIGSLMAGLGLYVNFVLTKSEEPTKKYHTGRIALFYSVTAVLLLLLLLILLIAHAPAFLLGNLLANTLIGGFAGGIGGLVNFTSIAFKDDYSKKAKLRSGLAALLGLLIVVPAILIIHAIIVIGAFFSGAGAIVLPLLLLLARGH